jgi:hypothetical protein
MDQTFMMSLAFLRGVIWIGVAQVAGACAVFSA